jgi:hypothetical protein
MIRSALLVALFTLVGCGSETAGTGSPGAGGAGGSGAPAPSAAAAYVGTYAATFSATSTFSSPAGTPPASYTDSATITVTAKGSDGILMAWRVGSNPPSGTIEFKLDGSGQASGTGGTPWMGRLTNGAQQTSWCDVCSASVSGDKLTQSQQGHFEGVTANGIPYAGTYVGTWSGTRTN